MNCPLASSEKTGSEQREYSKSGKQQSGRGVGKRGCWYKEKKHEEGEGERFGMNKALAVEQKQCASASGE